MRKRQKPAVDRYTEHTHTHTHTHTDGGWKCGNTHTRITYNERPLVRRVFTKVHHVHKERVGHHAGERVCGLVAGAAVIIRLEPVYVCVCVCVCVYVCVCVGSAASSQALL